MQFDGVVGTSADDDFLAAIAAEMADDQPIGGIAGQRPAAAGAEVRLHRLDRARPLDAQRGHRSASRRRELNDLKRLRHRFADQHPRLLPLYDLPCMTINRRLRLRRQLLRCAAWDT